METNTAPDHEPRTLEEHMSTPGGVASAVVFIALFTLFPILLSDESHASDLMALLCFVPTIIAMLYAKQCLDDVASWKTLLGEYAVGYCMLTPMVFMGTFLITFVAIVILFMVLPVFHLMIAVIFQIVFCLIFATVEESATYIIATRRYEHESSGANPKRYVIMPLFASLGLATGEAYYCSLLIWRIVEASSHEIGRRHHQGNATADVANSQGGEDPHPVLFFFIILMCCMVFMPSHMLSGYYIGLGCAKRRVLDQQIATPKIIALPIAFRAAFFYFLFFLPAYTYGISLVLTLPMLFGYFALVKAYEREMPQDYLSRTGYMNIMGYGVLGSSDVAEDGDTVEIANDPAPQVAEDVDNAEQPSEPRGDGDDTEVSVELNNDSL